MNRLPHQTRFTLALRWALGTAGGHRLGALHLDSHELGIRIPTGDGLTEIRWYQARLGLWHLEVYSWTRRPEGWQARWMDDTTATVDCRAVGTPHQLISIAAALVGMGGLL